MAPKLFSRITIFTLILWLCFAVIPAPVLTASPAPATINPGETLIVAVGVNNVSNLYGVDIRLSFDPAKLEVVDADPLRSGIQVTDGNFLTDTFAVYREADNTAGTIKYVVTQVNPTPERSGSGVLFYVSLRGKSAGTTTLHFTQVDLATRDGQSIDATSQDGTVILTGPPVCQAVTLTTDEDTTGEASPSCPDEDTGDTLTYSIVAQPGHGSASVVAGNLSYTPAANYNGADSFTYKANDSHIDSNTTTVNVTINPVINAPIITSNGGGATASVSAAENSTAVTTVTCQQCAYHHRRRFH